jgi:hypothetical protein
MAEPGKGRLMLCLACKGSGELWIERIDEWETSDGKVSLTRCWHCRGRGRIGLATGARSTSHRRD